MTVTLESLFNRDISKMTKTVCVGTEGLEFKIKPISREEYMTIAEQSKGINDDPACLFIAKGCVEPNFNNLDLIQEKKAIDGANLVSKYLLAGEITQLADKILELSGFGDAQEKIKEAKN